ncbi:MAG: hypothetical protein IKO53_00950 [Lachnospiraceae bacterium]|nr:hypothetical protein [Lachnospiraceae bacterium]
MDDTKFCPSCGDQVPVTTKYCDNCGYAFPKETIPGASVYTPPVMNVQPVVNNTPVANAQPEVNNTPVANAQPAVNNTPVTNAQPEVNNTPVANAQSVADNTASVNVVPVVINVPAENSQPVINNTQETAKPDADTEPVANDVQDEKEQKVADDPEPANNVSEIRAAQSAGQQPVSQPEIPATQTDVPIKSESVQQFSDNRQNLNGQMGTVSMTGVPGNQAPVSQPAAQQMQNTQFGGAQMPNNQMNEPQMAGSQPDGPQMNNQQPGGPVLMNPAYATAVPPEKPKGHGCLIAVLVAIMIAVIVIALIACGILATQLEGVDDLFSDAGISGSIGGKHSIVLSDTETVYMEVGDTHTITVENIDDFFSPRDIDWTVAGGGYYSNDVIRIDDNYDGSVTVTALNPGKTSVIVSGRNVDKEEGYVVKIDVSEKSLEYGDVLSGGEFSFEGTAWETSWGNYYFVGPQAGSVEISQFEADRGMPISSSDTACMMISDYYSDYAYGSVECRKVTENDIYSSMYYNDVAAYLDDGAEIYWFTYQPEIECIYGSQSFGNEYDVLFIFEPSGDVYVYDSGLAMTGDAKDNASWLTYDEIDERFSSY